MTDSQYEEIYMAAIGTPPIPNSDKDWRAAAGRAAFEASVRIAAYKLLDMCGSQVSTIDFADGYHQAVNRLRALAEPEADPAVEAVKTVLGPYRRFTLPDEEVDKITADVVAAVRNADAAKKEKS